MDKKMISKRFFPIVVAVMLAVALVIPGAVTAAPEASATRTLPASADAGASFDVGIEASGCGFFGQVVETLPTGFSYVSTDSTDVDVTEDGNTVSFTFMGDAVTFDYTVTASSTAGTYSFSGIVKDEDRIEYTTGGDTNITVGPPAAGATATRTLPASADAGASFDVGIEASGCGFFGQVVETLPTGFSYVSTDSTDVDVTEDGNTVSFTFMGDAVTFDYTVTASITAGTYSFFGIVKDEDRIESAIGGDTNITVILGWDIISTPIALDPSMDTWGEFSADLDIAEGSVTYYFDGSSQIWKQVSDSYKVKPCDAIYVKMASEDTVSIIASSLPSVPSKQLYAGWNLVGLAYLPSAEGDLPGMKANEALISVEEVTGGLTGYVLVVSPQVNQPAWIYTGGDINDWVGESPPDGWMLTGNGYWVFMINDGTLAGFTFTPLAQGS